MRSILKLYSDLKAHSTEDILLYLEQKMATILPQLNIERICSCLQQCHLANHSFQGHIALSQVDIWFQDEAR